MPHELLDPDFSEGEIYGGDQTEVITFDVKHDVLRPNPAGGGKDGPHFRERSELRFAGKVEPGKQGDMCFRVLGCELKQRLFCEHVHPAYSLCASCIRCKKRIDWRVGKDFLG